MPMAPTAGRELVEVCMGLLIDAGISTPSSIVEVDAGAGDARPGLWRGIAPNARGLTDPRPTEIGEDVISALHRRSDPGKVW